MQLEFGFWKFWYYIGGYSSSIDVPTRCFSFGTELIIPGYNNSQPVEILDRGRVIRGNRLDIYFDPHNEAMKWAVKYLPVKVKIR